LSLAGQQPGLIRPEEADFAKLAEEAPSSAGFYIEPDGQVVVVVRDASDDSRARGAVNSLIAEGKVKDSRGTAGRLTIARGQFTFAELAQWRDVIFDKLFGEYDGVTSLDLDEQANRVTIGVVPSAFGVVRSLIQQRLVKLGIDTAAVRFLQQSSLQLQSAPLTLNAMADTLIGGLEIQTPVGVCTMAIGAEYYGVPGLMTAAHCSTQEWITEQSIVSQPAPARTVGYETADPYGWSCGFLGINTCRNSDATFYTRNAGIQSYRGIIARPLSSAGPGGGNGSLTINQANPYFLVTEVDQQNLVAGQVVQKVGRTTGWTYGTISQTCVDHHNGSWPGYNVTLCTYQGNYTQAGGDSGSPVFMFPGGGNVQGEIVTLVGIHLGAVDGLAVFSKWGRVAMDFAPNLTVTRPATLTAPAPSGVVSQARPSLTWSGVAGAAKYNVYRLVVSGATQTLQMVGSSASSAFIDSATTTYGYYGASQPPAPNVGVRYHVYALNQTAISAQSAVVWFTSSPLNPGIVGPSAVSPNTSVSWGAAVWGGALPYSYQWYRNGTPVGTGQSVTLSVGSTSFQLSLVVTDGLSVSVTRILQVNVISCPPPQIFC
jgi:hypothetical protein